MRMYQRDFGGNGELGAMSWRAVPDRERGFLVIESYDRWETYIVNCEMPSMWDAMEFIDCWFDAIS